MTSKQKNKKSGFVSIIIPVLNNNQGLERTLQAISSQTYPKELYEIIVVDNGSKDSPEKIASQFGAVFYRELSNLNSPYSARNRGLGLSKGDIIVLLDATCVPCQKWLEEGVKCIQEGYDLVGGDIIFDIHFNSSIGELFDAFRNVRMMESIQKRQVAKAGNLFIRKIVFEKIGCFPEGIRSGGDIRWTSDAVQGGFKIGFCKDAKAQIAAKPILTLIKKQWRVAKAQPAIWTKETGYNKKIFLKFVYLLVPRSPITFRKEMNESRYKQFLCQKAFRLWILNCLISFIMKTGNIYGAINLQFKKR